MKIFLKNIIHLLFIVVIQFITVQLIGQNTKLIDYTLNRHDTIYWLNENDRLLERRIITEKFINDTLFIKMITDENGRSFGEKSSFKLNNDSLFFFSSQTDSVPKIDQNGDTIGWSEPSMYECGHKKVLEYTIKGLPKKKYTYFINGDLIELKPNKYIPASYKLIGSEEKDTLYYNDEQGYQYYYFYYDSGEIRRSSKQKGKYEIQKIYYKGGILKSEIEYFNGYDDYIETKYDEFGNITNYKNNHE